ncbi:MAG: hypothetical protein F6K42_25035 [Leptolyngbya sp. SIO1D8]|nr:hypothetical protein [Leptolyngbya sp. SIO1D8]
MTRPLRTLYNFEVDDLEDFSPLEDCEAKTLDDFGADDLDELAQVIAAESKSKQPPLQVSTAWLKGACSVSHIGPLENIGRGYDRDFSLIIDELESAGGNNLGPSPQEVVLSALNTFIVKLFTESCTLRGIRLEKVELTSSGSLDLWQLLGMPGQATAGYESLSWTLTVKGDATPEQFQKIFETVLPASHNMWNLVVMF